MSWRRAYHAERIALRSKRSDDERDRDRESVAEAFLATRPARHRASAAVA